MPAYLRLLVRIATCGVQFPVETANGPAIAGTQARRLGPVNWFSDHDDARSYVFELSRLWVVWILGLVALFAVQSWYVLLAGVVVIGLLIWLVRPIQARAAAIDDPGEMVERSGGRFGGARTRGEMALRVLLYGEAPLSEAVNEFGLWWGLIWVRRVVIAISAVAFAVVFIDILQGPV